jgi:hypothetical protein
MEKVVHLFEIFKTIFYFNFYGSGRSLLEHAKFDTIWTRLNLKIESGSNHFDPAVRLWHSGPHVSVRSPCFSTDRALPVSTTVGLLPAARRLPVDTDPPPPPRRMEQPRTAPLLHIAAPFKTVGHRAHAPRFLHLAHRRL